MTIAVPPRRAIDRIGVSESQAIADAAARTARAEARYRVDQHRDDRATEARETAIRGEHWASRPRRNNPNPPMGIDNLVAWFRGEWEASMPEALHAAGMWFDTVTANERAAGLLPAGGSLIGTHRHSEPFRQILENSPHQRDRDGELLRPFRSGFAQLRQERRHTADALTAVAMHAFDWRQVAGRPFYGRVRTEPGRRVLVMSMPEDILEVVLVSGLERLWQLVRDREGYLRSDE